MDNQQDQFGASTSSTPGRTTPNSATGAAGSSRKSATSAGAQSSGSPEASYASTGADRQPEGQQANAAAGTMLDTALSSGKKWIEDSGVLDNVNQLPQTLKNFGNRAVARVSDLSTTQKVVGGALLAVGLGWLATRKGKSLGNSLYNYGRQGDAGSYGRRTSGYQAPDASSSRRPAAGSGRADSGSAYGSSGSRYGSAGIFSGGSDAIGSAKTGSTSDHDSRTAETSSRKSDDFRSVE